MQEVKFKNVDNSTLDADTKSRRVKVVISKMEEVDSDGDLITYSAYNKTISERGPKGKNLIYHLTDHNPSLKSLVGKFSELYTESNQLIGVTEIPNTNWGNDMLEFYTLGHINQHSVGFRTIKGDTVTTNQGQFYKISEIKLYEGSAVLWGANENTPTLSVGKSLLSKSADIETELQKLESLLTKGQFTDETFELLQIRKAYLELQAIQPQKQSTEPEQKDYSGLVDHIKQSFSFLK